MRARGWWSSPPTVRARPAARGRGRGRAPAAVRPALTAQIRHMLRLDEDLSAFYVVAAADPALAWVVAGAGRMLRSPTVFEDLVKTICTTNCTWSATVRMVSALVGELGDARGGRARAPRRSRAGGDRRRRRGVLSRRRARRLPRAVPACARRRRRRRAGSTLRRWATRRCPTRMWPTGCWRSPASGPTRWRT